MFNVFKCRTIYLNIYSLFYKEREWNMEHLFVTQIQTQ
jgi:hypothetical protein